MEDAIYALKVGEVTKTPIKIGDNYYIVGVNSREEAKTEEFAKTRDQLVEQKLAEKRGRIFSDYIASVKREMETKKDIVIYPDVLAKLDALTPADAPTAPQSQIPPELQRQIQEQLQQQQQKQAPAK